MSDVLTRDKTVVRPRFEEVVRPKYDMRNSGAPSRAALNSVLSAPAAEFPAGAADGDLRGTSHIDIPEPASAGKYIGAAVIALALVCGVGYAYHAGMFTAQPKPVVSAQQLPSPTPPAASSNNVAPLPTTPATPAPVNTAPADTVQQTAAPVQAPVIAQPAPVRVERHVQRVEQQRVEHQRAVTPVDVPTQTPLATPTDTTPVQPVPQQTVTPQTTTNSVAAPSTSTTAPAAAPLAPQQTPNVAAPADTTPPAQNTAPQPDQQPQTTPQQ